MFRHLSFFALLFVAFSGFVSHAIAQEAPVDFHKTIKPLFDKYCLSCHGPDDVQLFRIDIKDDAMDYIEKGNAEESSMYLVLVTDDENELMPPPDENNPMAAEEIELVKKWIDMGAHWPASAEANDQDLPPAETDAPKSTEEGAVDASPETPVDQAQDKPEEADPALANGTDPRIFRAIGSLHTAVLHLPVGLLLAAGLFALFSFRGNFVMSDCAYYCLWLGALGAILASVTGWFSPLNDTRLKSQFVTELSALANQNHSVFWHRTGGLILTVVSVVIAMFAKSARNRDPDDGLLWKLSVMLLALGVGWVGHEGGKLTHGNYHYKDLKELGAEWFPTLFGNPPQNEAVQPPADNKPAAEEENSGAVAPEADASDNDVET